MMLKMEATRGDILLIHKIAKRAAELLGGDLLTWDMDITACHLNGCPLDLDKFYASSGADFGHDAGGIRKHISRETGELQDCFLPRCAC